VTNREREFADAARVIDESVAIALINAIVRAVRRATLSGSRPSWSGSLKGPLYVVAAIAGCLTHALLLQFLPAAVAPARPMAYGMVVAFAVFVAIAGRITARSRATATADNAAGTANTRKS
jgi:hypothetical protein